MCSVRITGCPLQHHAVRGARKPETTPRLIQIRLRPGELCVDWESIRWRGSGLERTQSLGNSENFWDDSGNLWDNSTNFWHDSEVIGKRLKKYRRSVNFSDDSANIFDDAKDSFSKSWWTCTMASSPAPPEIILGVVYTLPGAFTNTTPWKVRGNRKRRLAWYQFVLELVNLQNGEFTCATRNAFMCSSHITWRTKTGNETSKWSQNFWDTSPNFRRQRVLKNISSAFWDNSEVNSKRLKNFETTR